MKNSAIKTKYEKNFFSSRNKLILKYCKNKKVLHIWACDAPRTIERYNENKWLLLYKEIDKICKKQLWIDLDKESIEFLNSKKDIINSNIIFFDMNKLDALNFTPDIIIFWEVIEHLMNLETALINIKKVMWKNTLLLITTPNAFWVNFFINSIFWIEYQHEDHKVLFSYATLSQLLIYNNFIIEKKYFTKIDKSKNNFNLFWKIHKLIVKIINKISIYTNDTLLFICKIK
jgi:2-polyprenyl-3-methyl-5-hydroxy-6-metoxy-1,4-benzoquinol methylase